MIGTHTKLIEIERGDQNLLFNAMCTFHYLAKLTARVSRMTVILTCPGYVISS